MLAAGGCFLIFFLSTCAPAPLPEPLPNYRHFLEVSADRICKKMLQCFSGIYRTISPALKEQISADRCRKSALSNLDFKLSKHSPVMKQLSASCYNDLLAAPCNEFASQAYWNPSCLILRKHAEDAFSDEVP